MGRFYKASSGRILCIENDEKLTQEECTSDWYIKKARKI